VTRHVYEIRVIGSFGPATSEAFADMAVQVEPTVTVLSADLDQHGLHAVLDRVRALGLELIEIKQAPPSDGLSSCCRPDGSTRPARSRGYRTRLSAP